MCALDVTVTVPDAGAARLIEAGVTGLGAALPPGVVPNAEIAPRLGVEDGWIERRTGIRERRHAAPGTRLADLAAEAAGRALDDAQLSPEALDLVLVATLSQDAMLPNTAPVVATQIGATRAGAI